MNRRNGCISAILIGGLIVTYPQTSDAEEFTGVKLLTWSKENQNFYFQTSVGMAALVSTQSDKKRSQCISEWYFDANTGNKNGNDAIRSAIREYADYHPQGVIIAVLQKACGSMDFSQ